MRSARTRAHGGVDGETGCVTTATHDSSVRRRRSRLAVSHNIPHFSVEFSTGGMGRAPPTRATERVALRRLHGLDGVKGAHGLGRPRVEVERRPTANIARESILVVSSGRRAGRRCLLARGTGLGAVLFEAALAGGLAPCAPPRAARARRRRCRSTSRRGSGRGSPCCPPSGQAAQGGFRRARPRCRWCPQTRSLAAHFMVRAVLCGAGGAGARTPRAYGAGRST